MWGLLSIDIEACWNLYYAIVGNFRKGSEGLARTRQTRAHLTPFFGGCE